MEIRKGIYLIAFLLIITRQIISQNVGFTQTRGPSTPWSAGNLILHPSGDIYCLLNDMGDEYFLRSTNDGFSWNAVSTNSEIFGFDEVIIDKDGNIYSSQISHLFRSSDSGLTWDTLSNNVLTLYGINSKGYLFASEFRENGNFSCSTNNGYSWERRENGLPQYWNPDIKVYLDYNDNLYLMGFPNTTYKSTDDGLNWTILSNSEYLFITVTSSGILFTGEFDFQGFTDKVYRSNNNGVTWQDISENINSTTVQNIIEAENKLFLYDKNRVLTSTDNGDIWIAGNLNLSDSSTITSMVVKSGGFILIGTDKGEFYRSVDYGLTWNMVGEQLRKYSDIQCIALDSDGYLFLGTYEGEIFSASAYGETFTSLNFPDLNQYIISIAISSQHDIYAVTSVGDLYKTTNNGAGWNEINNLPSGISKVVIDSENRVFGSSFHQLYRSTDNGTSWELAAAAEGDFPKPISALEADNHGNLFAYIDKLKMSSDGGQTWIDKNNGLPSNSPIDCIEIDEGGILYAGAANGGFFTSGNFGDNWIAKPTGIPSANNDNAIIDIISIPGVQLFINVASAPGYIVNTIERFGVFTSVNEGATWDRLSTKEYVMETCADIAYSTKNNLIYAATAHGLMTGNPLLDVEKDETVPTIFNLLQNYPNPFNPSTVIEFSLPEESFVELKVYDILGKEIETLAQDVYSSGTFKAAFEAANLPSGIYIAKFNASSISGNFNIQKSIKMILIK